MPEIIRSKSAAIQRTCAAAADQDSFTLCFPTNYLEAPGRPAPYGFCRTQAQHAVDYICGRSTDAHQELRLSCFSNLDLIAELLDSVRQALSDFDPGRGGRSRVGRARDMASHHATHSKRR